MASNLIEIIIKSFVEGSAEIDALRQNLDTLAKSSDDVSESAGQTGNALGNFKDAIAGIGAGFQAELGKALSTLEEVREQLKATGQSTEGIEKVIELFKGIGEGVAEELAQANKELGDFGKQADQGAEAAKDLGEGAKEGGKGVEVLNTAMTSFGAIAGGVNPTLGKLATTFSTFLTLAARPAAVVGLSIGLIALAKHAANAADEVRRLAQINGIAIETFSALKVAAELNDVSMEQLSIGLRTLNRQVATAITQGGAIQKQFLDLGLTNQQLASFYGDSEAALEAVAKQIAATGSVTEKTRLATLLFGRAGRELIPLLDEIAKKGLPALRKEAQAAGLIISKETARAANEFNNNLKALGQRVDAFVISSFLPFVKALNYFIETYPNVVKGLGLVALAMLGLAGAAGLVALFKWSAIASGVALLAAKLGILVTLGPGLAALAIAVGAIAAAFALLDIKAKESGKNLDPDTLRAKIKKLNEDKKLLEKPIRDAGIDPSTQPRIKALEDQIRKLTEVLEDYDDEATDAARAKLGETFDKDNEAAQQLRQQVVQINAEIAKTRALARIQVNILLAEQTGDTNQALVDLRTNLEAIRKAELVKIRIQFEQDEKTSGANAQSLAAAAEARDARVRQLNESLFAQEQDFINRIAQIAQRAEQNRRSDIESRRKADESLTEAQLEHEKQIFDLTVAQIPLLDQVLERATQLANKQADAIRLRIAGFEEERNEILNNLALEQVAAQDVEKQKARVQELNAEIQKQNTLLLKRNDFISEGAKKFAETQKAALSIDTTLADTQLDTLNNKIEKMRIAVDLGDKIPFGQFLEVAKEIDKAQARILDNKIKEHEIDLQLLIVAREKLIEATTYSGEFDKQIDAARAAIAQLRNQAVLSATDQADKQLQDLERKINEVASNTAKGFVDRLIEGLENGKTDFEAFFKNIGKTLFSDLLQEALKTSLKPLLREQALAIGEKPADTMGGQLIQQVKYLLNQTFGFEFGKGIQAGVEPLKTSAEAIVDSSGVMRTAADKHIEAANLWINAAQGLGAGGVRVAGQASTPITGSPDSIIDEFEESWREAFKPTGASSPSASMPMGFGGGGFSSFLPAGMNLFTGLGALTGPNGGGASGFLTQLQGGLKMIQGVAEGFQAFQTLMNGSQAGIGGWNALSTGWGAYDAAFGAASSAGSWWESLIGLFGSFFGGGAADGGMFGFNKGGFTAPNQLGNLVSSGHIRKFRSGDMIRGSTIGVLGEEGPEIVARVKPAGSHDMMQGGSGGDIKQTIFIVDQRRPNLGPEEVEMIVSDSAVRGRGVGKAIENVIKRRR